ncbi:hypothetical protein COOONC_14233 [Cooperia oncophora]
MLAHEPGYDVFDTWKKKYGPVYTYWIGALPFVIVADYKTIKETFVKDGDAYAGKFTIEEVTNDYRGGRYGMVDAVGAFWRDQRRFALHVFKDLGLSKDVMEQRVCLFMSVFAICKFSQGIYQALSSWSQLIMNMGKFS